MAAKTKALAIIAGVGSGTGASVARKFAQAYSVALLARNPANHAPVVEEIVRNGGHAVGFSADVTDPASVKDAFDQIARTFPDTNVAAAVYNASSGFVRKPFLELTLDEFAAGYKGSAQGAFLFSQAVIPLLLKSVHLDHPPTLIFTGATASIKGSAQLAAFATGKFALRALSQSLAREFGPQGVHVSHVIVDGIIDIERTKAWKFDAPDAKLSPDAIADTYWHLHTQPRTSFTYEIDLRPYVEKW
ncbi:hypothetical protein VTO42DRAFT_2882 [Malbranchea cinnamomea]